MLGTRGRLYRLTMFDNDADITFTLKFESVLYQQNEDKEDNEKSESRVQNR